MKKPFYPRTNTAGLFRQARLLPIILGVVILILLFLRFVFPGAFFVLAAPLWKTGDALTHATDQLVSDFTTKQSLQNQLETAKTERDALAQENQTLKAQITDIQKLLNVSDTSHVSAVAGVIARPPVSPYETLIITFDSTMHFAENTLVVGPGGVPLGTITSMNGSLAQVKLFSERGRANEGWIGEEKIPATLVGSGTGSFEAELPEGVTVTEGDAAYLPGPGALFVGTVVKITTDQSTQKKHLSIRSKVNPFSITWVGVVGQTIAP